MKALLSMPAETFTPLPRPRRGAIMESRKMSRCFLWVTFALAMTCFANELSAQGVLDDPTEIDADSLLGNGASDVPVDEDPTQSETPATPDESPQAEPPMAPMEDPMAPVEDAAPPADLNLSGGVRIVPRWQVGDVMQYDTLNTREQFDSGQTNVIWNVRRSVTIEVLEAEETGYLLGWTYGDAQVENESSGALKNGIELIAKMMAGQQVLLRVSANGVLERVDDWEALAQNVLAALDEAIAEKTDGDAEQMEILKQQVTQTVETEEGLRSVVTPGARVFMLPYDNEYSLDSPVQLESTSQNPYGARPFPMRETFVLREFDPNTNIAQIAWQKTMIADQAVQILNEMLDVLSSREEATPELLDEVRALWLQDDAIFRLNTTTGTIQALRHRQAVRHSRTLWDGDTLTAVLQTP